MRALKVSVAIAFVGLLIASGLPQPTLAYNVQIFSKGVELVLHCSSENIYFKFGSNAWFDLGRISATTAFFANFTQTGSPPNITFGFGCDPNLPSDNATLLRANPIGVLFTLDPTQANGSIYGIFYYGTLGIPAETTFSEQNPVENGSYFTSYTVLLSTLTSPAVYLNETGGYIEWRVPATIYPQDIYFTNRPTHSTIPASAYRPVLDCSQFSNWPTCIYNLLVGNPIVLLIVLVFGGIGGFLELTGRGLRHLMRHRHKEEPNEEGYIDKPKSEFDTEH